MSSLAISNSASTTLPAVEFHKHGHGHKKGMSADSLSNTSSSGTSNSTTGQLPVGAAQGLFASLLQTLEQVIGVQPATAATATTAAGGTSTGTAASAAGGTASANPAVAQNLNGFLHSLFQVLKQEESGTGSVQGTGINGAPAVTGASTVGQYQGSLASSLQSLIQQVGSSGPASPAIANLDNSFSNLINGLNGGASSTASTAGAGAATATATATSNAALQGFLNNLLQNLQANGLHAPNLTGTNVNANV